MVEYKETGVKGEVMGMARKAGVAMEEELKCRRSILHATRATQCPIDKRSPNKEGLKHPMDNSCNKLRNIRGHHRHSSN